MRNSFNRLKSMAIFASVVEKDSFSIAARDLGLTTSAVSQQILSLEEEMGILLLERGSRRKLKLTEAGRVFLQSCQEMVSAAKRGLNSINEFGQEMSGELCVTMTPELDARHILPALLYWLEAYKGLQLTFKIDKCHLRAPEEDADIAVGLGSMQMASPSGAHAMTRVDRVLCASSAYLKRFPPIQKPEELVQLSLLVINNVANAQDLRLSNTSTGEKAHVYMSSHIRTNNVLIGKALCMNGHGVVCLLYLDVQSELASGQLVELLPQWKMQDYLLYAICLEQKQKPAWFYGCFEAFNRCLNQLPVQIYPEAQI